MSTTPRPIRSVLVANRGEIACRVIRSLQAMGLRSVAVHSQPDAGAPHTQLADQAVAIGAAAAAESYLNIERIIAAARQTGADAIHPGYGFLSENEAFARACEDAGLVFIGPPRDAIRVMGNKAEAKRCMQAAGVPCIPGYQEQDQSDATLQAAAQTIGFPLMVKAAAGGGGRGMRLVESPDALPGALQRARSEARNAFGSDELILEKAIIRPRHVEIQVFADDHGNCIHLGERDCSVQRRHQKVLEEAPCPVMSEELRAAMGEAAIQAARAVDYRGAGTVEFLLDAGQDFYFLEMNTRLQVEHPVTELVTGQDLVEWQIRIAQGEPLPRRQDEIELSGHAIEARLYCEDPDQDFLPATGRVDRWLPASGPGVRIDAGIASGQQVSPYYDPMVAKLIGYGPTRDIARQRLLAALRASSLFGPRTNKTFLIRALEHPVFAAGEATTALIDEQADSLRAPPPDPRGPALAALALHQLQAGRYLSSSLACHARLMNWSSGPAITHSYQFAEDGPVIRVTPDGDGFKLNVGEDSHTAHCRITAEQLRIELDGERLQLPCLLIDDHSLWLSVDGREQLFVDRLGALAAGEEASADGDVRAPMHGVVLDVKVSGGEAVEKGQPLIVLEAMKMQHELGSPVAGVVEDVCAEAGQQVASDDILIRLRIESDE